MDRINVKKAVTDFISKYKFVALIFAVGLLLMILPDTTDIPSQEGSPETSAVHEDSMEEKLSQLLSRVKGAGQVQVMLSYVSGQETIYQTDKNISEGEKGGSEKNDTVILTDSDRNQAGLIQRIDPPVYRGALVICQGADDPAVKLAVVEAVARITGLSTDKICVLKMK